MTNRALLGVDTSTSPPSYRELQCDTQGRLIVSGAVGGGGGGGTSDTLEATQQLVKVAVQNIDVDLGAAADAPTNWYTSAASVIQLLKLSVAAFVGAGSHVYSYNASGQLVTDAWTLFGTARTKTYTYTADRLTGETDWI